MVRECGLNFRAFGVFGFSFLGELHQEGFQSLEDTHVSMP